MSGGKAFGIPISSGVYRQLEARKDLLKDNSRVFENNMLLNNKGAWVRVVSSVNTKTDEKETELTEGLASNFILQGGVLKNSKDDKGNSTLKNREGLKLLGNFLENDSAYTYDALTGFRPMIGINSFTVQSQGAYGTLKKAEIGFSVWSLEQLDAVERLYFRPGFNILVEYGASAYYDDKDGNVSTFQSSLTEKYLKKQKKLSELEVEISELEESTSYNYSAFLGRIINFSWSYNKDGGFDCSVSIQAKGEIVESLSLLLPNSKKSGINEFISAESGKDKDFTFLKALHILKKKGDNVTFIEKYVKGPDGKQITKEDFTLMRSNRFNIVGLEETATGDDAKYEPGTSYQNSFVFINLGGLLGLCNSLLVPENEDGEKETQFRINRYEQKLSSTFITFPGHIGLNPGICALKLKEEQGVYFSDRDLYGGVAPRETRGPDGETTNIYSILVNVDHLINIVEGFANAKIDNSDANANVFTFLKKVLSDINTNLGGINKLDLDLDKRVNEWRLIDRNYYDPETSSGDSFSTLDLVGLGSLVTDFKLESKISGELTKMLAISAAVSGDDKSLDGIVRYNDGVQDRFKKKLSTGPSENKSSDDEASDQEKLNEKALDYGQKVADVYKLYATNKKWDREAFRNASTDHSEFTKLAYKHTQRVKRQSGRKASYSGIIPLNLSFTIEGISGLKVGEAFKIQNNILPSRYHNKVGFIITGLTDSIGTDNRWVTDITTKMFNLPSTETPDPTFLAAQQKIQQQKEKRSKQSEKENTTSGTQLNVRAKYGEPGDPKNFSKVAVPRGFNLTYDGKPVRTIGNVHKDVADSLRSAFDGILKEYGSAKIKKLGINIYSGVYNKRSKRGGTTWSMHSWGIAIDLYASKNALKTKSPNALFSKPEYEKMIKIFEQNGWYSLGKSKNYDWMHFQAWDPNSKE